MKHYHTLITACGVLLATSCNFSKSVKTDLSTGLTSKGNGLSCDNLYLTDAEGKKVTTNTFVYGQKIALHFDKMEGFKRTDGQVYPAMALYVMNKAGDTILRNPDAYAGDRKAIRQKPLQLMSNLVIGEPITPGSDYTLVVRITDKEGDGTFDTELPFSVIDNPAISIKTSGMRYRRAYLYNVKEKQAITGNKIRRGKKVHIVYEGLNGFVVQKDLIRIGYSMKITDKAGHVLMDEKDLAGDQPLPATEIQQYFSPNFLIIEKAQNPITVESDLWDKDGSGKLHTRIVLEVEG